MKKILLTAFLLTLSLSLPAQSGRTAVFTLHPVNIPESTAGFMTDAVRRELAYFEQYDVLSADEMEKLINSDEIKKSQLWSNPSKAGLYAEMLNCSMILTGTIEKKDNVYIIVLMQIDPVKNKYDKIIRIEKPVQEEKLYFLAADAVKELVFSREGSVALVSDSQFNSPDMAAVSKGVFNIGSEKGRKEEFPVHRVNITHEYRMARFEITNSDYCSMLNYAYLNNHLKITEKSVKNSKGLSKILYDLNMKDRGIGSAIYFDGQSFRIKSGYDKIPVTGVTWYGAAFYCNMLSEKQKLTVLYDTKNWEAVLFNFKGYRLPTEAEWEYAAQGGRFSKKYVFPGSDDFRETGWLKENSDMKLHETGQLKPNELGIHDLCGNAAEWCHDFFDAKYYTEEEQTNPKGPGYSAYHSLRGGSFRTKSVYGTVYSRSYLNSEKSSAESGFRPILIIP